MPTGRYFVTNCFVSSRTIDESSFYNFHNVKNYYIICCLCHHVRFWFQKLFVIVLVQFEDKRIKETSVKDLKIQLHLYSHYIKRLQTWGSSIKWLTLLSWSENKLSNMKYNVKKCLASYLGAYNRNYPDWNLSKTYIISL